MLVFGVATCLPRARALAPAAPISLTYVTTSYLKEVDTHYVNFNIDTGSLYNGLNFSDAKLRILTQQLAPATIRVGGTAVDSSYYFPDAPYNVGAPNQCGGNCPNGSSDIGNAMIDALFDFALATDMTLNFDVNGESFRTGVGPWDPAGNWTAMSAYISSTYGGRVNFAYSVSNEPDIWPAPHKNPAASQLAADAVALKQSLAGLNIGQEVTGPAYCCQWDAAHTRDFLTVAGPGGVDGYTVHSYPYGGRDCTLDNYLDKSKVSTDLAGRLATVASTKAAIPSAAGVKLTLEETAGSSGGGCNGITNRFVAGLTWINTLMTVGRSGFDRVHRQDIVGWSFAFGVSNYALIDPPGWTVGSRLLRPNPDYFTTILWKQLVGRRALATTAHGAPGDVAKFEANAWCASARSPYGAQSVVLAYAVFSATDVALALPPDLAAASSTQFILTATGSGTPYASLQDATVYNNGRLMGVLPDGSLPAYPIDGASFGPAATVTLPAYSYGFLNFAATPAACAA